MSALLVLSREGPTMRWFCIVEGIKLRGSHTVGHPSKGLSVFRSRAKGSCILAKNIGGKTSGPPRRLLHKGRQKGMIVEVQSKREQRSGSAPCGS